MFKIKNGIDQRLTRYFVNWKGCFTVSTKLYYFANNTTFFACDKSLDSVIK